MAPNSSQTMKTEDDMPDSTKQSDKTDDEHARRRRNTGRMTLKDVADHMGVSQISVSRYFQNPQRLSKPLRERIGEVVAELGYVPNLVAGGLASARNRVIGMVIPNISGPIFADTIQSFSDAVTARGYQLLLASSYFSEELEESAVRAFLGWSPAALPTRSASFFMLPTNGTATSSGTSSPSRGRRAIILRFCGMRCSLNS